MTKPKRSAESVPAGDREKENRAEAERLAQLPRSEQRQIVAMLGRLRQEIPAKVSCSKRSSSSIWTRDSTLAYPLIRAGCLVLLGLAVVLSRQGDKR
jgi:hypothetical protein